MWQVNQNNLTHENILNRSPNRTIKHSLRFSFFKMAGASSQLKKSRDKTELIRLKSSCTDFILGMCPRVATGSRVRKGAGKIGFISILVALRECDDRPLRTRASLVNGKEPVACKAKWKGERGRHEIELDQPTSAGMKSRRE